eukprot:3778750-Amphidinium_carterae.3
MAHAVVPWCALYYDHKESRYLLYHVHSEEKVHLPEGRHHLHVSADGNAYLSNEAGTQWCDDLLEVCVFQHPTLQQLWVEERSGNKMALSAFQQRFLYASIPFKLSTVAAEIQVPTYILKQSVGGTRVLFSLQSWHQNFIGAFAKLTFSRWLNSWFPWWVKSLSLHNMHAPHLRKAKSLASPSQSPLECFEEVTLSLPGAIALFSKWSGQSKGKSKDKDAQESWLSAFRCLVHKFINADSAKHSFIIFLDTAVSVQLGLPMSGSNRVICELTGTTLDLGPILLSDVMPVRHSLSSSHCTLALQMDLVSALVEVQNGGRKLLWLFNQLLHNVAQCLEVAVLRYVESAQMSASSSAPTQSVETEFLLSAASGVAQRRHQRCRKRILWKPAIPTRRRVLKYFLCYRDVVSKAEPSASVHLAFDASRVGGRAVLVGFCTTDGVGFWLPPQVHSGQELCQSV